MMEKFLEEHASKKASYNTFMGRVENMTGFFGNCFLFQTTPRLINSSMTIKINVVPMELNQLQSTVNWLP